MALRRDAEPHSTAEERFVLETDWRGYGKILDAIGDRHVVVTYDNGRLELLSPSPEHEMAKALLGSLTEVLLDESATEYVRGGSITFRQKGLDKGLEPDDCFWISNWKAMVNVKRWIPRMHPPPDLAIEIEATRHVLKRLPILAAMRIAEVWRWRSGAVSPLGLETDGSYHPLERSRVLPSTDFSLLTEHMRMAEMQSTFEIKRSFRARLRGQA